MRENIEWILMVTFMKDEKLWDQLKLNEVQFPYVIAIVGSGGKTSLLGALAREGKLRKKRVAVLTTTHIRKPAYQVPVHLLDSDIKEGSIAVFGKEAPHGKITYPGRDCYEQVCKQADVILVEADGSRGLPIKVPASHEPVIPVNVNMIIAVCGLSALGKPGADVCHRWELAMELLKIPLGRQRTENITEQDMAILLTDGYHTPLVRKYPAARFVFCLNQADTEKEEKQAADVRKHLDGESIVLSLKNEKNIIYEGKKRIAMIYMASGYSRRFGANKLIEPLQGKPLFQYGLDCLVKAKHFMEKIGIIADIVVVSQYNEILRAASRQQVQTIQNPNAGDGVTASIRLGLQSVQEVDAVLFAVADQPWLKPETVYRLVEGYFGNPKGIACLMSDGKRGNPVIFSIKYKKKLEQLQGDKGGSQLMGQYPDDVVMIQAEDGELRDIDVKEDIIKSVVPL